MLSATGLVKRYASILAVDGVSLEARPGRILGLLGPNGAGKTTTIRMLLRIIPPDGGHVSYDGAPWGEATADRIGYLPEERGLYRKARVLPTIVYFAGLRGVPAPEARRRAAGWIARLELTGREHARIEELSKGNQQKVQLIIALLHEPQYVVLDEPFSGLDPINQELLVEIFDELRSGGRTVIFSTHGMHQAEQLCDDICLIDRGRVVLAGGLPAVRAGFGRETAKMEFSGDAALLDSVAGIRVIERYAHSAEVLITDPARVPAIIAEVASRLDLRLFERRGPSLNAIFLETVKSGRPGREGAPP